MRALIKSLMTARESLLIVLHVRAHPPAATATLKERMNNPFNELVCVGVCHLRWQYLRDSPTYSLGSAVPAQINIPGELRRALNGCLGPFHKHCLPKRAL